MYDARQIANWFVQRASADNRQLSIMQLLKLVYIAHGWHLEMANAPLIKNRIEAWKHGPVIPDVYNSFWRQGIDVSKPVNLFGNNVDAYTANLLEYVYSNYGNLSARRLSDLTHEPGGPWETATKKFGYFAPITNDLILPHYQMKRRAYQAVVNG